MNRNYFNYFDELIPVSKERRFTDRTQIMDVLMDALVDFNQNPDYYHIFSIHGIGGIGKSRLVKEFIQNISPEPVFFITFEIEKCSEVINNLYYIRKKISSSCPVFDYALLRYWEITNPSLLNEEFMNHFKKGFFTNILDMAANISGCASSILQTMLSIPAIPTPSTIVDFMNSLFKKVPQLLYKSIFQIVALSSSDVLVSALPHILGVEFRWQLDGGKIEHPIFIFDSYQESQPYAESEEWLYHLISSIGCGFFIVTGREAVHWKIDRSILTTHLLECYPIKDARKLLEDTISERPDLVDLILKSTQCIPIYMDLALNIYEEERNIVGTELVEQALFLDRHKLVQHFINHFRPAIQSSILDLASVGVFNQDIFQYLAKERMLACSAYDYSTIIQSNLFHYISEGTNSSLVKLHDVFCRDVQRGRPLQELYSIFKVYLTFICYRRDVLILENKGSTLAALFQNALSLAIDIEKRMKTESSLNEQSELDIVVIEKLLDIFFTLASAKIRFNPQAPESVRTSQMESVCKLIYAKLFEKENTLTTIQRLEEIKNPDCFGKHILSYKAILYYAKSLGGQYHELKAWMKNIDAHALEHTQNEWFYNRIKVYQCDYDMMCGHFKMAKSSLLLLANGYMTNEDYYSIHRTVGHIQRFNFQLNEAKATYRLLLQKYKENTIFREYLTTNLYETECYFPSKNFIHQATIQLNLMMAPYSVKNKAKILYSLAIANIVKRHYRTAEKYIKESIKINQMDGYISGELFAYMAQAYLDYACNGTVSDQTLYNIEMRLQKINVYRYFELPLAIMQQNNSKIKEISTEYEWLDFAQTLAEYRRFLSLLKS